MSLYDLGNISSALAACDECSGSSYNELVVARPREASSEAASLAAG